MHLARTNGSGQVICGYEEAPPAMSAKEVIIIVLVLVFWLCAILLFINRWGKIRMLEPYMPDFKSSTCEEGNATNASTQMNSVEEAPRGSSSRVPHPGQVSGQCERRSSLLMSMPSLQRTSMRRVKSAVDLVSLVIAERREATAEQRRSRFQNRGRVMTTDRYRACATCDREARLNCSSSTSSVRLDCSRGVRHSDVEM